MCWLEERSGPLLLGVAVAGVHVGMSGGRKKRVEGLGMNGESRGEEGEHEEGRHCGSGSGEGGWEEGECACQSGEDKEEHGLGQGWRID
eukprot:CAMPEP_0184347214 /NCGR_PEP_ID=MMETSP1089-20130417/15349_1 /TAXON_ID=38269 ORGANISM="Gloeochaete wittrockiana, Strain SAG46.84" /NCGR_SAMPLE_ID=MMETSP1089 /ASSEMBLY_ACC=CAM_ASM_000445 /LENGTH=88 /DNA_ID=CAMNT_0026678169 /DNA_START=497 /DNA_END=763 /DNA_ORIENTATION=+